MKNNALSLAEITNYTNKNIKYLKNVKIEEWDIKSAGFTVLKFKKILPENIIKEWEFLDKHTRSVKEGLLQKSNPKIAEEIIKTLAAARKGFVLLNNIQEWNILSIKKDAMFLINTPVIKNFVKDFEFRKKGEYSSYISLNNKEFYYNSNSNVLDVKGLSADSKEFQKDYFLKDLKYFLKSGEKLQYDQLFSILKNYRKKYLNRELPLETYRNLDDGKFRVGDYTLDRIDESLRNDIDITQNYINYLLPLFAAMV